MKSHWPSWLDYTLLSAITIIFFVISRCGFFMGDDIAMGYGVFSSIKDVLNHTKWFYLNLGGRYLSVAAQYLFDGLIKHKVWFDIVNTLFFVLLIFVCGRIVRENKEGIHATLLFALCFWFLCPSPSETLFWAAGATTHLWANALAFVFVCLFLEYKDKDFSFIGKIGLFCISVLSAAEFIPCASICGALVTYYAFHFKALRKNAIPLVSGFAIGSALVLLAPGNFLRATDELIPFVDRIKGLLFHPAQEIIKYKALWLFLIVLLWGWIKDKATVKAWIKQNVFLLLSLGWGIIAFSIVFRPAIRALFFPEALTVVLALRFLYDNPAILKISDKKALIGNNLALLNAIVTAVLFTAFILDAKSAIVETNKQRHTNDVLLKEIVDSGGIVALDRIVPEHRMAYHTYFPKWVEEPLAERFGLDSIHIYPHFCQNKLYTLQSPLDNVFIEDNYAEDDIFGKYDRLTIRVKEDRFNKEGDYPVFHISYSRPRKWYKVWLDKLRNYQYDRLLIIERRDPDVYFKEYFYYVFWMKKENVRNLKGVNVEIKNEL